jgi:hypothetical protein
MAGYSIFIAHAPADTRVAEELTSLLAETGATVLYGADTSPTPEALDELEQAALAADAYVALLSRASIASPRIRAVTRKYHDLRQADPRRILLPVSIEPLLAGQLWPFLLDYPRIEAVLTATNAADEGLTVAPQTLALGIMQALRLPIPAHLRRITAIPVDPPVDAPRFTRSTGAPITGSLVPQLHPPPREPWRPSRTLTLGALAVTLVVALVATLAFFGGATPFHLADSAHPRPTATFKTVILATATPAANATAITAPTTTATPQRTATPHGPAPTATLTPLPTETPSPTPSPTPTPIPAGTGLSGHYYSGTSLQEPVALTRLDPTINFDWGTTAPDPQFQGTEYSVRWTGRVRATTTATYTFTFIADDGVRLYFNGATAIDAWIGQGPTPYSFNVDLNAGQFYAITIEYFECCGGDAVAQLSWDVGQTGSRVVVPTSQLYPQ